MQRMLKVVPCARGCFPPQNSSGVESQCIPQVYPAGQGICPAAHCHFWGSIPTLGGLVYSLLLTSAGVVSMSRWMGRGESEINYLNLLLGATCFISLPETAGALPAPISPRCSISFHASLPAMGSTQFRRYRDTSIIRNWELENARPPFSCERGTPVKGCLGYKTTKLDNPRRI